MLVRRAHPDARLVCFCDAPERIRQSLGDRSECRSGRAISRAGLPTEPQPARPAGRDWATSCSAPSSIHERLDALIVPGTGILDDFGCGPMGAPLIFLFGRSRLADPDAVWLISIGAGPIVHPLSRRLMVWAAKLAQFRSYRDAISKLFLAEAGVDTANDPVFPDLAFDLARPIPTTPCAGEPLTVGLGVMDYGGWNKNEHSSTIHGTYRDSLARFCIWLLETGHRIRLLPGDDADNHAISSLRSLLELRLSDPALLRNVVAEPAHNLNDVMRQMAETDVVVATRFHNVVCALKTGKPTLSLSYAQKNAALLDDAGLGSYMQASRVSMSTA